MKKLSKKIISIVLALIMAMPMMIALPSTASAAIGDGNKIFAWDFVSAKPSITITNTGGENRGTVPSSTGSGTLSLECWSNGNNLWRYDGSDGMKSDDGVAWIENLGTYLHDGKDIDITFTSAVRNKIGNTDRGVFCIGSAYVDSGSNSTANNLLYLDNNGNLMYNHSTSISVSGVSAKPTQNTFYTYRIHFDYSKKRLNVYRSGELIGTYQNNSLSYTNFGCLTVGACLTNNWNANTIRYISVSEYDSEDLVKNDINNFDLSGLNAGSAIRFSSGGDAYSTNVIYSANGNFDSNFFEQSIDGDNKIGFNIYPASSRAVYVYEDENSVIGYPLIDKTQRKNRSGCTHEYGVNYLAVSDASSSKWYLDNDWFVTSGDRVFDNIYSSQSDKDYGINKISYQVGNYNADISIRYDWGNKWSGHHTGDTKTHRNIVKFKNSNVDFNGGYTYSITNSSMPTFKAGTDSGITWTGGRSSINNQDKWSAITINGGTSIELRVLNIKPFKDLIGNLATFKSNVSAVAANEWMYTSASLTNYYNAVANVMKFNVNGYDYSNDTKLAAAVTDMQNIMTAYTNAVNGLTKKTFNITYNRADGNRSETVTAGDTLASIPSNSTTKYSSNNQHNVYGWTSATGTWDGATTPSGTHKPHSDETYYETVTSTDSCTPSAELSVDSDGSTHNGYKYHECTVCHHEMSRTYNDLDWGTYDTNKSAYDTATTTDAYLYTDDTLNACTTAVTSAISGINRGTMTGANTPQSTVNTAATAISDALANLKGRAAFGALDAAKATAMNWANDSARAAEYTSSSILAYKDYLNSTTIFPFENTASRTNTPATAENNAAISAEKTAYENAQTYAIANILDPLADLTTLESAYEEGDAILKSLVGKTAQYDAASVQALIDAVEADGISGAGHANIGVVTLVTSNAAARADYGSAVQTDATTFANNINNAINGLTLAAVDSTTGKAVDTSAFDSLVNTLNNLDPDAYEENEGGSLASAKSTINSLYGTATKEYEGETINVVNGITSQAAADTAANKIQTALTVCTKKYTITRSGVTDFGINNGTEEGGKVNYGATLTCRSGDDETAWFIEVQTGSMHKKYTFQSYGKTLKTKVLGTTTVNAIKRDSTNNCRIMITRSYGDDREPIQYASFVPSGTEFTLPAAPSIAYTTFNGYSYKNGSAINTATITVTEDVDIVANYTESDASCAINATDINGDAIPASTVNYNAKVELDGGAGTYGWIEQVGTTYRPFYKGQKVSFLATESTTLLAVNQATFDSYGKAPIINLRKGGVIVSDSKYIFNAQLVPGNADVREYGILIAAPSDKNGATPIAPANSQIIVENSGQHEGYAILRAKSTKLVGANQFSIAVNNLPSGYKYRGYVIYHDGSSLQTVYTDIH